MGPYHSKDTFQSSCAYLQTLKISGWRVFPQPVRFNSKTHKDMYLRKMLPTSRDDALDAKCAATVDRAAASGALQAGQIWIIVGEWRPDDADSVVQFQQGTNKLYTTVLLLRNQRVSSGAPFVACHLN